MIFPEFSDTMIPKKGGFFRCPFCGAKLLRSAQATEAEHLPVWCRNCKREILIDIHRGQSYLSRSPGQSTED